jgi:hypothetical protein
LERSHPFFGEDACLTSKHSKLRAVEKPLRQFVGLRVREEAGIDTDLLGTFSGEVPRSGTPSEVAIRKASLGAEMRGCRLGLATEGSFGPNPLNPWIPGHLELIALVDRLHGVSIVESVFTERTNFRHCVVGEPKELSQFLERVRFPSHAVMVLSNMGEQSGSVFKAIQEWEPLERAVRECALQSPDGKARVESDMRAHLNPTRQLFIRAVARKLARRLLTLCPECSYPGWGHLRNIAGLECEECGLPGSWTCQMVSGCQRCRHEVAAGRPDGLRRAPASVCENCNP